MGQYTDKLFDNIRRHLAGSEWLVEKYKGKGVRGIHLVMPEGLEMSEPYQQRIWDLLTLLPNIDAPAERLNMSIRMPGWTHYYQTVINPNPKDLEAIRMIQVVPITKEGWLEGKVEIHSSDRSKRRRRMS